MNLAVFGATGAIGRKFVALADDAGLSLRLHCRASPPDAWPHSRITVVGALTDRVAMREVVRGSDAVVVLFAPREGSKDVFCAVATRAIVLAMRAHDRRRLICVSCAHLGEMNRNISVTMRAAAMASRRFRSEEQADDRKEQERIVRSSRLDWTLVKTARFADDEESNQRIEAGPDVDIGMRSNVSRELLARFLLKETLTPEFGGQVIYVAGA